LLGGRRDVHHPAFERGHEIMIQTVDWSFDSVRAETSGRMELLFALLISAVSACAIRLSGNFEKSHLVTPF
jgi:hypothetical protein